MLILNDIQNGFGLDIGDRSMKLLRLEFKKTFLSKQKFIVKNYAEIKLPEGVVDKGEIKDEIQFENRLVSLLESAGRLPSRATVVSLPETKTFLKTINLTAKNRKEIPAKITEILPTILPLAPEEIYLDWQIIASDEEVKKSNFDKTYKIFLAAAPKTIVDNFLKIFKKINLLPIAFEIEAVALCRALFGDGKINFRAKIFGVEVKDEASKYPRETFPEGRQVIIDLGATQTSLIIADNAVPAVSISLPLSGNRLTEIIAEKLKINFEEAEKIKKFCGFDPKQCDNKTMPVVSSYIKDICKKIFKTLQTYPGLIVGRKRQPITLSGGCANASKIDSCLAKNLKIKVKRGTPLELWNIQSKDEEFNQTAFGASTVIGLALRGVLYPFPENH